MEEKYRTNGEKLAEELREEGEQLLHSAEKNAESALRRLRRLEKRRREEVEKLEAELQHKPYSRWDELPDGRADDSVTPGCLVVEGGAFRGLYNEGVMDALMLNGINFHTTIGVSAGALAGVSYVSGQIGRSARVNLKYRHDSRFIGTDAFRSSHSILNIDFLLKTSGNFEPTDYERLYSPKRRFVAEATNCLTGESVYFEHGTCKDMDAAIKASASMPFVSPMVDVDGTPCLDGGCSCHIPYGWAMAQGFEKIVVIRTRDRAFRKEEKLVAAAQFYRRYPAFARKVEVNNYLYNHECDEMERLEGEGRVFVIAPREPVQVGRLEPDLEKLGDLYWLGYRDTLECLDALREYLG